jgi:uncharacterized membrane protein
MMSRPVALEGHFSRSLFVSPATSKARTMGLVFVFLWFAIGGVAHFVATEIEMRIVPPYIPWPRAAVLASGVFELLGAAGLLWPRTRRMAGIGLILLMVSCFATLDTSAKLLGQALPVIVSLFARYLIQALIMGTWLGVRWARGGINLFRTEHPRFQALRGCLLLACSALLFFGIRYMPVAEFTSIGMLTPVLVTVLAALFLHEHVSLMRALLVLGGFIGALVVTRPGSGLFGWVALIPLAMALVSSLS